MASKMIDLPPLHAITRSMDTVQELAATVDGVDHVTNDTSTAMVRELLDAPVMNVEDKSANDIYMTPTIGGAHASAGRTVVALLAPKPAQSGAESRAQG